GPEQAAHVRGGGRFRANCGADVTLAEGLGVPTPWRRRCRCCGNIGDAGFEVAVGDGDGDDDEAAGDGAAHAWLLCGPLPTRQVLAVDTKNRWTSTRD